MQVTFQSINQINYISYYSIKRLLTFQSSKWQIVPTNLSFNIIPPYTRPQWQIVFGVIVYVSSISVWVCVCECEGVMYNYWTGKDIRLVALYHLFEPANLANRPVKHCICVPKLELSHYYYLLYIVIIWHVILSPWQMSTQVLWCIGYQIVL